MARKKKKNLRKIKSFEGVREGIEGTARMQSSEILSLAQEIRFKDFFFRSLRLANESFFFYY